MNLLTTIGRTLTVLVAASSLTYPALAGGRHAQTKQPDPFADPNAGKRKAPEPVPTEIVVPPPSLEERAARCKSSAPAGESVQGQPCMYLVNEVSLSGISRSESGVEAFVYAAPTKQTILVHEGDRLFDGRVVTIDEPDQANPARIVIEQTTQKRVGKKLVTTTATVTLTLQGRPTDA